MTGCHRIIVGLTAAAVLTLPMVAGAAAPKKKPAPKKPPAAAKADPKAGQLTFQKEGCAGCHITKDFPQGGKTGPDLSNAGTGKAAAISAYIHKPKAGSIMPAYKGPKKGLDDMTAYLMTQK